MRPRLPLRVRHHPGECAASLASRAASAFGARDVERFCRDLDIGWLSIRNGTPHAVRDLAKWLWVDAELLIDATPWRRTRRRFAFKGFDLRSALEEGDVRVCDVCLAEDRNGPNRSPYYRGLWCLAEVRACPVHGHLLRALPPPGKARQRMDFTAEKLAPMQAYGGSHVRPRRVDYERWLVAQLSVAPTPAGTAALNAALDLARLVGLYLVDGGRPYTDVDEADWQAYAQCGHDAMAGGWDALAAALDARAVVLRGDAPDVVLEQHFGGLITTLYNYRSEPARHRLRTILGDVAQRNLRGLRTASLFGATVASLPRTTSKTLARKFGLARQTVDTILRRSKVPFATYRFNNGGTISYYAFDAEAAEQAIGDAMDRIDRTEACKLLGFSRNGFDQIATAGLLTRHSSLKAGTRFRYGRAEVLASRERIMSRANAKLSTKGLLPPTKTVQRARCNFLDLARLVLDGGIERIGIIDPALGWEGLRFDAAEVRAAVDSAHPCTDIAGITIKEFSTRHRVREHTVHWLIREELLAAKPVYNPRSRIMRRVCSDIEVGAFSDAYATTSSLADQYGCTVQCIVAALRKCSVVSMTQPPHSPIYRRCELPDLWETIRDIKRRKASPCRTRCIETINGRAED